MASDVMASAALGRPFTLGMLYDARKHALIPGFTLWNEKTLQEKTIKTSQPSSKFEISSSDSIESKSNLLDVDASLKASFLGGLIEVGGSAKYLNDQKKSHKQSRVTFQYSATTIFEQLSMIDLEIVDARQNDIIKKGFATHVVTGITYGANAFFVFDSDKLDTSSVQDIQGHMEAVIKKIPSFSIEGEVNIKLTDAEKALTDKFSCTFYGDFLLKSNPATFEDAVQTYVQLPQLLGEDGEKSVPVKVWLMPLKDLVTEAAELKAEISDELVRKVHDTVESVRQIVIRCNDSLEDRVVQNFPEIREELSTFQNCCLYHITELQKSLAEKLPSIREGKEDESTLKQVFEVGDESPFCHENLNKWMDHKEREINVIRFCVDTMKGTKIVPNQNELDKEVLAPGVEEAVCFVFTSLETADPYLDAMTKYLDSPEQGSTTSEDPWYFSNEVFTKMREKAKWFNDLAKSLKNNSSFCFLIAAIANEKYKGATVYQYKEGILVTEDASMSDLVPDLPPVEDITKRSVLMQYATDLTLDPNTANNRLTLSEENKKATCGEKEQPYPDLPERFDSWPQVLCKEELTGRHYWEVEGSPTTTDEYIFVIVAVTYKEIAKKRVASESAFKSSPLSWCFVTFRGSKKHVIETWHEDKVWEHPYPSGCSKVGVYLDWPAGTLSFYRVDSNTLTHLYTFKTKFTEPVCPGLGVYFTSNHIYLSPVE